NLSSDAIDSTETTIGVTAASRAVGRKIIPRLPVIAIGNQRDLGTAACLLNQGNFENIAIRTVIDHDNAASLKISSTCYLKRSRIYLGGCRNISACMTQPRHQEKVRSRYSPRRSQSTFCANPLDAEIVQRIII